MEKPQVLIALEQLLIQNHISYKWIDQETIKALDINIDFLCKKGRPVLLDVYLVIEENEGHAGVTSLVNIGIFKTNQLELIIDLLIARSF